MHVIAFRTIKTVNGRKRSMFGMHFHAVVITISWDSSPYLEFENKVLCVMQRAFAFEVR